LFEIQFLLLALERSDLGQPLDEDPADRLVLFVFDLIEDFDLDLLERDRLLGGVFGLEADQFIVALQGCDPAGVLGQAFGLALVG
jgi:hypothetical protein